MTDGIQNTGKDVVSGEEGQDLLVGQAASTIEITAPTGGETKTVSLERGQTATLNFDATAATPVLEGNDFVLTFDSNGDGSADSRIVFLNLVEDAQGADAPVLVIGGIELPAGLLIGQAQALVEGETLETAAGAGAGPQGGGGSTYDENLGDIIDLLQAQQGLGGTGLEFGLLADGDNIFDPAEGTFSFTFATTVVDGADVSGPFVGGFEDWQANQHLGDETESPMQIAFTFVPADNEVVDSIDITSLPVGVTLYVGGFAPENIVFSSVPGEEVGTLPINILGTDLDDVYLQGDEHSDADIPVTITANISDPDSGETASITASGTAIIDAAADKPDVDIVAKEGTVIENAFSDLSDWTVLTSAGKLVEVNGGNDALFAFGGNPGDVNVSDIETSLGLADGTFEDLRTVQNDNNEGFFDGVAMSGTFQVAAGQTLTLDYEFLVNEVGDNFNDALFIVINGTAYKLSDSLEAPNGATQSFDGENWDESSGAKSFTHTFDESGDATISFVLFNEGDSINGVFDPAVILDNLSTEGKIISQDEETPELTTIPVSLTFDDFADGSETHEVKLEGVPADWVLDLEETFGEHAGLVTVTTETSGGFVTYTFDITDYVDRLNGIDPVTDTPDGVVGDGSVTIDFTFDPLDWTSQRLNDGSENEDGPAEITVTATATETDLSGSDLTDLNDVSTTVDAVVVDIQEDVPEVQDATLVHDESPFPQGDANDVWWIESSAGIALASSGFNFDEVDSVPGLLGFAQNEISVNFFSDGPNTGDAATDSTVDDNNVGQESFEFQSYDGTTASVLQTTAGEAIFLHTDPANTNIVWGLTADGDAVFAVHLEQPSAGENSSLTASFVQFQSVHNPDPDSHDEVTAALNLQIRAIDDEGDASEYANLAVTIQDDGPRIGYIRNNNDDLEESDLTRGDHKDTVSGRIYADFGVDGGKFTGLELKSVTDPDGTWGDAVAPGFDGNLTSDGVPVVFGPAVVIGGKLTLIGKAGDDEVIKVTLDEDSGSFKATLLGPIDHPDQNGDQQVGWRDQLKLTFTATVTDGDGDTASKDFSVRVKDDGPYLDNHVNAGTLDEENLAADDVDSIMVSGDISVNFGADGGEFSNIKFKGWKDDDDGGPRVSTLKSGQFDVIFGAAAVLVDGGPLTLIGKANGVEVIRVEIDQDTGAYKVILSGPVNHPDISYDSENPNIPQGQSVNDDDDPIKLRFEYTVTDGDGDTDKGNLDVVIEDGEVDAHYTKTDDDLSEAKLAVGDDVVDGQLEIDPSADGTKVVELWFEDWKDSERSGPYSNELYSGDKLITFTQQPGLVDGKLVLIGSVGDEKIITLSVDPDDGSYTVTLHGPVDHPDQSVDGSNTNDPISLYFGYKVVDADGDEDYSTVRVIIEDSEPVAVADTASAIAYGDDVVEGNVLDNDSQGADGAKVTKVTFEGDEYAVAASGDTEIIGDHGKLTISSDGEYRYEAFQNDDRNLIKNGSFENGHGLGNGKWGTFDSIDSWTNGDGSKFEVQNSSGNLGGLKAEDGTAKVELDGHGSNPNATVQQVVAGTNEGQDYTLTFSYSPRPGDGAADSSSMKVFWNGEEVQAIDSTGLADGWKTITVVVKGTGDKDTVLAFKGAGTANTLGAYIDNVSMIATETGGEDVFTYEITDGDGDTSTSTFSVSVDAAKTVDFSDEAQGIQAFLDYDGGPIGGGNHPDSKPVNGFSGLFGEADGTLEGIDNLVATSHGDYVYGSAADNIVLLGGGNDVFDDRGSGSGDDRIDGGSGDDTMWTGGGDDILIGGSGNDNLSGEAGNDILIGGSGNDRMSGGSGSDTFVFKADTVGDIDTVRDFKASDGDALDLSELLTGFAAGADSDATATVLQDYLSISQDGSTTVITIDQDGSGSDSDVTIRLENNDLTSGGSISEHDAIQSLLDANNLIVE